MVRGVAQGLAELGSEQLRINDGEAIFLLLQLGILIPQLGGLFAFLSRRCNLALELMDMLLIFCRLVQPAAIAAEDIVLGAGIQLRFHRRDKPLARRQLFGLNGVGEGSVERRHHSVAYFAYFRFGRRALLEVDYLGYLPQLVCGIDDIRRKERFAETAVQLRIRHIHIYAAAYYGQATDVLLSEALVVLRRFKVRLYLIRYLEAHFLYRPLCLYGIVVRYLGGEHGTARDYLIGKRFDSIAHILEGAFSRAELVRLYSRLKDVRLELLSGLRAFVILEHAVHTLEQLADVDIILVSEYRLGCLGTECFLGLCALLIFLGIFF